MSKERAAEDLNRVKRFIKMDVQAAHMLIAMVDAKTESSKKKYEDSALAAALQGDDSLSRVAVKEFGASQAYADISAMILKLMK